MIDFLRYGQPESGVYFFNCWSTFEDASVGSAFSEGARRWTYDDGGR